MNQSYGAFNEQGDEYIIHDYNTPRPQLNYMWNDRFLSGINHFGGGDGCYGNRAASYIDPEGKSRALLIRDGNRYFYVRDEQTGEVWNPGWYPMKTPLDSYKCTQGIGYTKIEGSKNGIAATLLGFVGETAPAELWTATLSNNSSQPKKVKLYSYIEFSLEGYARYSEYDSYVYSQYDKENDMIYAINTAQERPHPFFDGYLISDVKPTGFDSSCKEFLGTYGSIFAPQRALEGKCSNSLAACEIMAGVLEHTITLAPGEEQSIHFVTGIADCIDTARKTAKELLKEGEFDRQFASVRKGKMDMMNRIMVTTPVEKINNLTNYWVKNQVQLCAEAGRITCKGFRDTLQDAWGVAGFNPQMAREKYIETLRHQYSDGRCVRGWLPIDPHIYSDGPVWVAPAINAYLKETGDYALLDVDVPYLDEGSATVWEHILLCARHSSTDIGVHGLTLARDGDWNDSLNGIGLGGKGESVWTSIALCLALLETIDIAKNIKKDPAIVAEMQTLYDTMKKAVNDHGWDGNWYLAAYNDLGEKVGAHGEKEGEIYLNSQTWAVLGNLCEGERLEKVLHAVDTKLDTIYGPLTLTPPYTSYNPHIGRLTGFVPGIWENGAPYCHGGSFKIVADCYAGRGDKALETMMKIIPDSQYNPSSHSGCEPYVFTNMYLGPDNPRKGQTPSAWVTGTAGWMFRAVSQYMMGFYPEYDGFSIRPCIPAAWEECKLTRSFRGDTYEITIHNLEGKQSGVSRITLDGKEIGGNKLPLCGDGATHNVEVWM